LNQVCFLFEAALATASDGGGSSIMLPLPTAALAKRPLGEDNSSKASTTCRSLFSAFTSPTDSFTVGGLGKTMAKPSLALDADEEFGECHEQEAEALPEDNEGWSGALNSILGWRQAVVSEEKAASAMMQETPGARFRGRCFNIADSIEAGFARETTSDFTTPLRRSGKLWRFRLLRSEDRMSARLVAEHGEFLMYTRVQLEARLVSFYLYDPAKEEEKDLFDEATPAFTMSFNEARTEWRLCQERCENCQMTPTHLSCANCGKQQLAHIRHLRSDIGEGVSNVLEMRIPGIYSDGRALVWCDAVGKGDLGRPQEGNNETQLLVTKLPVWNEQVGSLVLDFKNRSIQSSAKNFQLALQQKPDHVICQFGKLSTSNFSLDFKFPLSAIQAFGAAMSTIFWT